MPRAALLGALLLAGGCRLVVDSGATFEPCGRVDYGEPFQNGTTFDDLYPKCWQREGDPSDALVDDGDLVLRSRARDGAAGEWQGDVRGVFVFQRFEGDFLFATRVEALDKVRADHCLPAGELAGLVARRGADFGLFMIGPFDPATPPPDYGCGEASAAQPPAYGVARTNAWGPEHTDKGPLDTGLGADTEADIAICRAGSAMVFFYRDPKSTEAAPVWLQLGGDLEWDVGDGPLDVGLSVAGVADATDPDKGFRVAGHFQWAWLSEDLGPDFCRGALDELVFPGVE